MKYTEKLNLRKPDYEDPVDIADINKNMDTLDNIISDLDLRMALLELGVPKFHKDFYFSEIWKRPSDLNFIYVYMVGAGGGGAGGGASTDSDYRGEGGAGGGGGACRTLFIPAKNLPEEIPIVIGWGGIGGDGAVAEGEDERESPNSGTDGESTIFLYEYLVAPGGKGASGYLGGEETKSPTNIDHDAGGYGGRGGRGTGSDGRSRLTGGAGGAGGGSASNTSEYDGGTGGTIQIFSDYTGGNGGRGRTGGAGLSGISGSFGCGGGGGGGSWHESKAVGGDGGNGGDGLVRIWGW